MIKNALYSLNKIKQRKKRMKKSLSVLLLSHMLFAGGSIAPALVEKPLPVEKPTVDESAFYLGVGISGMRLKDDSTDEEFSAKGVMIQAGYQYNKNIAIEGRYTVSIGDTEYDHGKTHNADIGDYPSDFTNIGVYLKPMYPIGDLNLYALLGYGQVELTNIPIGDVDRSEDGFQWGLGAEYIFADNISAFVDYVSLYDDKGFDYRAQNSDIVSDVWTFGISYRF
jgi:opacity protein-like surface antigen